MQLLVLVVFVVLTMTRVQISIAKKLQIFLFLVFLTVPVGSCKMDNVYNLYTSGIIEFIKSFVTNACSYSSQYYSLFHIARSSSYMIFFVIYFVV
jgi:hypothetical protein